MSLLRKIFGTKSLTEQRIESHRKWLRKMYRKHVLLPKPMTDDRSSIEINRRILARQ